MRMYHGTSESIARKVLIEGIRPRSQTGNKGNWENTVSSARDRVYLTDAYALYFGFSASQTGERWAVIEVETSRLDDSRFLPDEDFLEQATRGRRLDGYDAIQPLGLENQDMKTRTEWYRNHARLFQMFWRLSLEHLGCFCYDGRIPPEAITRVVLFDPKKNDAIMQCSVDPSVSILNYRITGSKYRAMTKWLVGKHISIYDFLGFEGITVEAIRNIYPQEYIERIEALLRDRSAIEFLKGAPAKSKKQAA